MISAKKSLYLYLSSLFIASTTFAFTSTSNHHLSLHTFARKPTCACTRSMRSRLSETGMNGETSDKTDMTQNVVVQTVGKTTSMLVAGTFYAVLAYQRDALMVSFFIGAISNGILSKVLKKIINQERPAEFVEANLELPPSDNGMPSSHAMSLGFICTFTALQIHSATIPLTIYVLISLWYRVQTKLHTFNQISVGLVLGIMNSFLWRSLCFGTNPALKSVNVMDWVTANLLNNHGLLPVYALTIPAIVGALVVGSVERRISRFFQNRNGESKGD